MYMRHHKFLPHKHRYHQWRTQFDDMIGNGEAPQHQDDKFVFAMIKNNLCTTIVFILYVLLQCYVDILPLNHNLMYVAEAINYPYVLFHINVQCIFTIHIKI
jgi:hypothetical protein